MSTPITRYAGTTNEEAASPPLSPADVPGRLRGRPSRLKGATHR
jgi:hypothetical protein